MNNGRHDSRNKNILIGALLAVVVIMGVGYAAFSQQLTINGTADITSTWNVHIQDIQVSEHSDTVTEMTANVSSTTQATFSTKLNVPGEYVTYEVTVVNEGTIPAILAENGITFTESNDEAIKYSYDGVTAGETTLAANGGTKTFTITVAYDENIEEQPSQEALQSTLTMTLNFVQNNV